MADPTNPIIPGTTHSKLNRIFFLEKAVQRLQGEHPELLPEVPLNLGDDFIIFGSDMGEENDNNHDVVIAAMLGEAPTEIFHAGDTYPSGGWTAAEDGYAAFLPYINQEKWFHCHGNHDYDFEPIPADLRGTIGTEFVGAENFGWEYLSIPNSGDFPAGWKTGTGTDQGFTENGQAPLGYGEAEVNTTLQYGADPDNANNDANNKWVTQLLRYQIPASMLGGGGNGFLLGFEFDDGFEAYLNGELLVSYNVAYPVSPNSLSQGTVGATVSGGHRFVEDTRRYVLVPHSAFSNTSTNVIAVMLKQSSISSSDTKFSMTVQDYTYPSVGTFGSRAYQHADFGMGVMAIAPYLPANCSQYVRSVGDVDYFFIDSCRDSSGNIVVGAWQGENSQTADWLRTAVAASTAAFKFVVTHDPPVSHVSGRNRAYMDWLHEDAALASLNGVLHGDDHISQCVTKNSNGFITAGASNFRNSSRTNSGLQATNASEWTVDMVDTTTGNNWYVRVKSSPNHCQLEWVDGNDSNPETNVKFTKLITA